MWGMKVVAPRSPALELKFTPPTLHKPPQKSSQSFSCVYPACDREFLSQARDPVWSLQTADSCGVHPRRSSWAREGGVSPWFCCLLGPCLESGYPTLQRFSVYGNTKQKAGAWSRWSQSISAPMPGHSATLGHPRSFCDPGDPETTPSHLGFWPAWPRWVPFRQTSKSSNFWSAAYNTFQYPA